MRDQFGFGSVLMVVGILLIGILSGGYYFTKNPEVLRSFINSKLNGNSDDKNSNDIFVRVADELSRVKSAHVDLIISSHTALLDSADNYSVDASSSGVLDIDHEHNSEKTHFVNKVGSESNEVETVVLGKKDLSYLKKLGPWDQWFRMRLSDLKEGSSSAFMPTRLVDKTVSLLRLADKNHIKKLADDSISGQRAEKYEVSLSNDSLLDLLGPVEMTKAQMDNLKANIKSETFVWINPETKLPLKLSSMLHFEIVPSPATGNRKGSLDEVATFFFSKYNEPLTIEEPLGEITDYQDYLDSLRTAKTHEIGTQVMTVVSKPKPTPTPDTFMEDFEKLQQEVAEKQKMVEENQKKFFEEHPNMR